MFARALPGQLGRQLIVSHDDSPLGVRRIYGTQQHKSCQEPQTRMSLGTPREGLSSSLRCAVVLYSVTFLCPKKIPDRSFRKTNLAARREVSVRYYYVAVFSNLWRISKYRSRKKCECKHFLRSSLFFWGRGREGPPANEGLPHRGFPYSRIEHPSASRKRSISAPFQKTHCKNPAQRRAGRGFEDQIVSIRYGRLRRQPTKPSDNRPKAAKANVPGSGTTLVVVMSSMLKVIALTAAGS